jgi:cytochrome c oxidase cbb3-type subunit 3
VAEKAREEYMKKFANSVNENNVTAVKGAKDITEGAKIYSTNCIACHGDKGQGGVGPNLTDKFWIHGGDVKALFKTLTYGVPEKGMIAWNKTLNPLQIQKVASFILTLQGTNPAGAKEPQGTEVK